MTEFAERGAALIANGYRITPIKPGTKLPRLENWTARTIDAQEHARLAANGAARDGVGIVTGDVVALDVDVLDERVAEDIAAIAANRFGATLVRVGKAPKRVLVYRIDGAPIPKRATAKWTDDEGRSHQVEVLGAGQQFVTFGTHPDTGRPYTWTDGHDPTTVALADLPAITADQVDAFLAECEIVFEWEGFTRAGTTTTPGAGTPPVDDPFAGLPKTGIEIEDVRRALERIDADDREVWFKVGAALHHQFTGDDVGRELWDAWSQTSHKFDQRDQGNTWRSFKPARLGAPVATILSVFAVAGVEVPRTSASAAPASDAPAVAAPRRRRFRLIAASDLKPRPVAWLVDEYLERGATVIVFGDPAAFKTFVVLDLALHLAAGHDWHGQRVERGHTVAYICGEGERGIGRRIEGWCRHHGVDRDGLPLFASNMPGNFTDEATRREMVAALAEDLRGLRPDLIVVDTLARNLGGDENDNSAINQMFALLDSELRALSDCTVILIGHPGHVDKERPRGASALRGNCDADIRVQRVGDYCTTLFPGKMKDAPRPPPITFTAKPVAFALEGPDGQVDEGSTLVMVRQDGDVAFPPVRVQGRNQEAALRVLRGLVDELGDWSVPLSDWRSRCEAAGMTRNRFHEAKNGLQAAGAMRVSGDSAVLNQ
jgi:hypothetical protein